MKRTRDIRHVRFRKCHKVVFIIGALGLAGCDDSPTTPFPYLSNMPYLKRNLTADVDGSTLVRTAIVSDGVEYDVRYRYTPGDPPLNLLPFVRDIPK